MVEAGARVAVLAPNAPKPPALEPRPLVVLAPNPPVVLAPKPLALLVLAPNPPNPPPWFVLAPKPVVGDVTLGLGPTFAFTLAPEFPPPPPLTLPPPKNAPEPCWANPRSNGSLALPVCARQAADAISLNTRMSASSSAVRPAREVNMACWARSVLEMTT